MLSMQRHLLPLALASAATLGFFFPGPGAAALGASAAGLSSSQACVVLVFLISGWLLRLGDLPKGRGAVRLILAAAAVNLAAAPALAWALLRLAWFSLPEHQGLALGLWIMMAVPTTLSSGMVLARQAGGNPSLATLLTLALILMGTATTSLLTASATPAAPGISAQWALLAKIVLLPLLLGMGLRRLASGPGPRRLALIPSLSIVILVWMSASAHQGSLAALSAHSLAAAAALALGAHLALFALAWGAGRLLDETLPNRISLAFTSSQKTLPLALALLMARPAPGSGMAVAFCLLFHFLQIAAGSVLAARLRATFSHFHVK